MFFVRRATVLAASLCVALCSSVHAAPHDVSARVQKTIESFEAYCFQTNADYKAIKRMAGAAHLQYASKEIAAVAQPLKSGQKGEVYVVAWPKYQDGLAVLLAFSKEIASCSIYAQGITFADIEKQLKSEYHLVLAQSNDVGLQISEMYVPGGTTGGVNDAKESGLVMIIRPKPSTGKGGVVIGYMPPEAVARVFSERGD